MDFVIGKKYLRNDGKFVEFLGLRENCGSYLVFEALEDEAGNGCKVGLPGDGWAVRTWLYTEEGRWLSEGFDYYLSLKIPLETLGWTEDLTEKDLWVL